MSTYTLSDWSQPSCSYTDTDSNDSSSPQLKRCRTTTSNAQKDILAQVPIIVVYLSQKLVLYAFKDLRAHITKNSGGKEIFAFYNKYGFLNTEFRKRLVNISVSYLQSLFPENCMPSPYTREQGAKALVTIFPKLRDPDTPGGYVRK